MAQQETGEQKLLRIIESQQQAGAAPAASSEASPEVQAVAVSVKGLGIPSVGMPPILANVLDLLKGKTATGAPQETFGIKAINNILGVVVVVVLFFFTMTLVNGINSTQKRVSVSIDAKVSSSAGNLTVQYPTTEEYLEVVKRRNIFQPFEKKVVEQATAPLEEKKISVMTKDLKLVGISWLDSPESASVMIEDTASGITYFLKQGEGLRDILIKTIYADSVVLSFQNEELLLRL